MTTGLSIRHYTGADAAVLRPLLLDVYAEVYAAELDSPFTRVERFAEGLDSWSARPGWSCVTGVSGDGQIVGYAYGAPLPPGSRWWGGLLTDVPKETVTENGTRTYALSELMVRTPWRKTGAARQLHDALLSARAEDRATLLVDQGHPRVTALYESWGWTVLGDLRPRLPDAPLFHAMLKPLIPNTSA
ncbi:GNAT family N-acetyltransferase [Streptomyces sp. NPDC058595]|uniref:GNAT family N-acetyltransferase n=1 Tax=Streptomyces sp. NPDC058595 TaxID=3346550 RepID=UPI003665D2FA